MNNENAGPRTSHVGSDWLNPGVLTGFKGQRESCYFYGGLILQSGMCNPHQYLLWKKGKQIAPFFVFCWIQSSCMVVLHLPPSSTPPLHFLTHCLTALPSRAPEARVYKNSQRRQTRHKSAAGRAIVGQLAFSKRIRVLLCSLCFNRRMRDWLFFCILSLLNRKCV